MQCEKPTMAFEFHINANLKWKLHCKADATGIINSDFSGISDESQYVGVRVGSWQLVYKYAIVVSQVDIV